MRYQRSEYKPTVPKSFKHDLIYSESQDRLRREVETTPELTGQEVTKYQSNFFCILKGKMSSLFIQLYMSQMNIKFVNITPIERDNKKTFQELVMEN